MPRPIFAKPWQVAILKRMYEINHLPSARQKRELVAETGLDKAWIKRWFHRQNRTRRSSSPTLGEKSEELSAYKTPPDLSMHEGTIEESLVYKTPPDLSMLEDTIEESLIYKTPPDLSMLDDIIEPEYAKSTTPGPSSLHPISSQPEGMPNIHPEYDELLASLTAQPGEVDHVWVETPHILAPSPHRILPAVDFYPLGYIPAGSRPTSHSFRGREQSALPQHTSTWPYSRDPLHDRYPDLPEFLSPAAYDSFHYGARLPELPSTDSLPTMDYPSSALGTDYTTRSLEHIPAARQSPIASSVSLPASWLKFSHTLQAEQASDAAQNSPSPGHV